jgi:hypothetical protein
VQGLIKSVGNECVIAHCLFTSGPHLNHLKCNFTHTHFWFFFQKVIDTFSIVQRASSSFWLGPDGTHVECQCSWGMLASSTGPGGFKVYQVLQAFMKWSIKLTMNYKVNLRRELHTLRSLERDSV